MTRQTDFSYTWSTEVGNAGPDTLYLNIEPWGWSEEVRAGESRCVVLRGPEGEAYVERGLQSLTIWGWVGSSYLLYRGDELLHPEGLVFPDLPASFDPQSGKGTRGFLGLVLGREPPPSSE
jgi:hypothetical protein